MKIDIIQEDIDIGQGNRDSRRSSYCPLATCIQRTLKLKYKYDVLVALTSCVILGEIYDFSTDLCVFISQADANYRRDKSFELKPSSFELILRESKDK